MDIIAHRGFSGAYPENTMLSFQKAVEYGADGIELDVHLSKDGELMIIHDESLKRTTGIDGFVFDYTRSELERINAGKTKNDEFGFTPIPSLEEYLSMIKGTGLYTNIELKTAPVCYPGIEEKTIELIRRIGIEDRVFFSSFNWLSIFRVRQLAPEFRVGLLFDGLKLHGIGQKIHSAGLECYHPSFKLLDDEAVRELKENRIELNVWTVNEPDDMKQCLKWGIDGLITNEVERARALLDAD